jgi:hypothetical protein
MKEIAKSWETTIFLYLMILCYILWLVLIKYGCTQCSIFFWVWASLIAPSQEKVIDLLTSSKYDVLSSSPLAYLGR